MARAVRIIKISCASFYVEKMAGTVLAPFPHATQGLREGSGRGLRDIGLFLKDNDDVPEASPRGLAIWWG
jgi:hypothetical protein